MNTIHAKCAKNKNHTPIHIHIHTHIQKKGAHIHLVGSHIYKKYNDNYKDNIILNKLTDELRKQGKKPYALCCGGSDQIGTWGYYFLLSKILLALLQKGAIETSTNTHTHIYIYIHKRLY